KKAEPDKDKDKGKDKGKVADKSGTAGDADKDKDAKDDKKKEEPVVVKIDIDGIGQRILSLPIPARNYVNLQVGKSGILFLSEGPMVISEDDQENLPQIIQKFDLSKRKVDKFLDEVNDYVVSFDGGKVLYRKAEAWATASTEEPPGAGAGSPPKPGFGPLKLDGWEVYSEPRAMWKQIYDETWRIERD